MAVNPVHQWVQQRSSVVVLPHCAFCNAADAADVYREEDYPDAPCCADEDACYERMQSR